MNPSGRRVTRSTRFLVIGAGPTGLGAAVRLAELDEDFLVVDSADRVGGMAASFRDDCGFIWDLGGHVIHSHFPEFDRAVTLSGVRMNQVRRDGWVWLRGSFVRSPIQQHLDELPRDRRPEARASNLAEYYLSNFGSDLYERFFAPFQHKMWGAPLELVDHSWTAFRSGSADVNVPPVGLDRDATRTVEYFPYPIGGAGALWSQVADTLLPRGSIQLMTGVDRVDAPTKVAHLSDGTSVSFEFCVSSAPIVVAATWVGSEPLTELRASSLLAVGLGFTGDAPPALAGRTRLYCPDPEVPWYRATMLSNYHHGNAGPGRWNVMCEVSLLDQSGSRPAVADTIASLVRLGAAESRIESVWQRWLPLGYPVPTLRRDETLAAIDQRLRAHGIYSRGRFGGWRYESSNQDHAYVQGRQAVDAALFDSSEDAYWDPDRHAATADRT